ncbi:cytochrome b/b6 domain-containing protein [Brevibacterium sp. FME17]|uniref:cytochrome b/b6 domain-containing protein n=1 Tax=Brevibacterium sp. FME17 TaxID=2742606 RepID=UPI001867273D|nr:cytochrome b/b6 domain-containing protein [Brevibacterium sp. FME17]
MATYSSSLRSGLPRVPGGEPWPPEGVIGEPVEPGASAAAEESFEPESADAGAEVDDSVDADESAAAESPEAAQDSGSVGAGAAVGVAGVAAGAAAGSAAVASEASSEVPLRRGLPRVEGGEPWPPEGLAPAGVKAASSSEAAPAASDSDAQEATASEAPAEAESADASSAATGSAASEPEATESAPAGDVPLRRGLPRVAGGEPWPPEGLAPAGAKAASATSASTSAPAAAAAPAAADSSASTDTPAASEKPAETEKSSAAPAGAATAGAAGAAVGATAAGAAASSGKKSSGELSDTPLRRGLPRVAGGDPWPPEGFAPASAESAPVSTEPAPAASGASAPAEKTPEQSSSDSSSAAPAAAAGAAAVGAGAAGAAAAASSSDDKADQSAQDEKPAATSAAPKSSRSGLPKSTGPAQKKPTAKPAAKATDKPTAKPAAKQADKPAAKASSASAAKSAAPKKKEPTMIGSKSVGQWAKLGGLGLVGLVIVAGVIVLAARGLTTLPGVPEFLKRYPGEYELPAFVDDGFPGWARWTHFLNMFFMVLIIRSGLQVRHQQKPPAFYTPKKGGKKVSINLWFHTGLDLLWMVNGVVFVVLLFVSDHWARIVPTSWEVFPNAVSAMLQYMMLDWPAEDGWVNYNSLQQLMYFLVVFVAAPLAAITGLRMSEWWPKDATKLNKIYPAPLARAIHFPTMIFFVVFILIHVFLVFTTGMLQNLNHMFSGSDQLNWVGFIWFVVSLAVIVGGWFAARPMLLAPIANMFGRVSSR